MALAVTDAVTHPEPAGDIVSLATELQEKHKCSETLARLLAVKTLSIGLSISWEEIAQRAGMSRMTAFRVRQTPEWQDAFSREVWDREMVDYRGEITRKLREKACEGHKDELLAVGRTIGVITPDQVQVNMNVTDQRAGSIEQAMRSLLSLPVLVQDVDMPAQIEE